MSPYAAPRNLRPGDHRALTFVGYCGLVLIFGLSACSTTPEATELPPEETEVRVLTPPDRTPTGPAAPAPTPAVPTEHPPKNEVYEALELKGVRGGRIRFEVDGRPDDLREMLLDFEHAAGHRAWAQSYQFVREEKGSIFARWDFEGKAGINPSVVVEFRDRSRDGDLMIRYRLAETAFGLGAFFGDYRATLIDGSTPPRSIFSERVFIDSGTWLANASQEEIEQGLREDARLIRQWMRQRIVSSGD